MNSRCLLTGRRRIAGKDRMAGKGCVAAPLLGGGWGWVYLHAMHTMGISARHTLYYVAT
jgi:hypothetical protein